MSEFLRLKRLPPYVFAEVNNLKAEARATGVDVIDFGMGNPDSPMPDHVVEKMVESIHNPATNGYSISRGITGLRKALAGYYERRFNVALDHDKEVVVTIGSKEGIANFASAISGPGNVVMVPNPCYPIHHWGFVIAGATVWNLEKFTDKPLIKQMEEAVRNCSPKPIAIVLNYPCNPTSEVANLEFYEEIVDFCLFHNIYIISDLAYCEIYFDDNPPPSILEIKKARPISIEFTTLSKTYSMAGCRIGFAAGSEKLVGALTKIKSYLDYGIFTPIQVGATAALNGPQDYVDQMRDLYKERRDVLIKGLSEAGWQAESPSASMFVWTKIPAKYSEMGSVAFSKLLLEKAHVAVAPGIGFGRYGDDYVRIALVENTNRIRQATKNIKKTMNFG